MCKEKFARRFSALLIRVIIGAALAYVGLAGASQTVVATPQEHHLDVMLGIGALMQSQCFSSTDGCCEYAAEMASSMPEDGQTAAQAQHVTQGMLALVEANCIEATDSCLEFAFGLVNDPVTRSVLAHPLPHEGE